MTRLDHIRERLDRATPGPWTYGAEMRPWSEFAHYAIRTMEPQPDTPWSPHFVAWMNGGRDISPERFRSLTPQQRAKLIDEGVRGRHVEPDAAFIAHAPEDVRYLLDEVDRLRAREAALESALLNSFRPDAIGFIEWTEEEVESIAPAETMRAER